MILILLLERGNKGVNTLSCLRNIPRFSSTKQTNKHMFNITATLPQEIARIFKHTLPKHQNKTIYICVFNCSPPTTVGVGHPSPGKLVKDTLQSRAYHTMPMSSLFQHLQPQDPKKNKDEQPRFTCQQP